MKLKTILNTIKQGCFFKSVWNYIFETLQLFKIYFPISYFLKIKSNKVVCSSYFGGGYNDNPKYIIEELIKKDSNWDIVWLINKNKISDVNVFPTYIRTVNMYSFKALYELATAKFWIDNCRKMSYVPKKKGQYYIQTWHGNLGPKKCEGDVENKLPSKYVRNAKKDSSLIDICISSGYFMTNIYKNSFWYNGDVLECGSPRIDILFNTKICNELKNKISKEYNCNGKKICLYAPTFRNDYNISHYSLDYKQLKQSLEKRFGNEWIIFVKLHPNFIGKNVNLSSDIAINVTKYQDTQELLAVSDCMISDYSSIIYDYMISRKPTFIFAPDYSRYISEERELHFPLDSTPFPLALNNEDMTTNILNFDIENYTKNVDNFLKKYGNIENGTASKTIVDWMYSKKNEYNKEEK